jgi:hypothetical protein
MKSNNWSNNLYQLKQNKTISTKCTIELEIVDGNYRYIARQGALQYAFATCVQLSNKELDKFLQYKINQIK